MIKILMENANEFWGVKFLALQILKSSPNLFVLFDLFLKTILVYAMDCLRSFINVLHLDTCLRHFINVLLHIVGLGAFLQSVSLGSCGGGSLLLWCEILISFAFW